MFLSKHLTVSTDCQVLDEIWDSPGPWGLQPKRPDGYKSWARNMVLQVVTYYFQTSPRHFIFSQFTPFQLSILPRISSSMRPDSSWDLALCKSLTYLLNGWQNADAAGGKHWKLGCNSPTDTMVCTHSDRHWWAISASLNNTQLSTSSQWRLLCSSGCQTSECQWQQVQQHSTHTHTRQLVHYCRWRISKNDVTVISPWLHNGIDTCRQRVRVKQPLDLIKTVVSTFYSGDNILSSWKLISK